MFEKARKWGISATAKGGWSLLIQMDTFFTLRRYRHLILSGFFQSKTVLQVYSEMLPTDLAGANKFLDHFDFPGRIVRQSGQPSQYVVKEALHSVGQA